MELTSNQDVSVVNFKRSSMVSKPTIFEDSMSESTEKVLAGLQLKIQITKKLKRNQRIVDLQT